MSENVNNDVSMNPNYNKDDELSRFQIIVFLRDGGSEFYDLQECKRFGCRKMTFQGPIVNNAPGARAVVSEGEGTILERPQVRNVKEAKFYDTETALSLTLGLPAKCPCSFVPHIGCFDPRFKENINCLPAFIIRDINSCRNGFSKGRLKSRGSDHFNI